MSDFYTAKKLKTIEAMLKHRGFKVEYTVNGADQMIINPANLGSNSNRAQRFNSIEHVETWLDGYDYALINGRELNGVAP